MKKIDWSTVKNIAELVGGATCYVLMVAASQKMIDYATDNYISEYGYNEAVKAIMDSGMYSHDKCDAVSTLKRDGDCELYKAIIHIVKDSRLYSHDKLKMVKELCQD